jgi:hypothetical protein
MHSGERAARWDPPVFAVPGGKMSSLQACIFVHHMLSGRRKRPERRWWQADLYRKRSVYSGTGLSADLKFQEFSGKYNQIYSNGTSRFWTTDKISRSENCENKRLWAAITVQGLYIFSPVMNRGVWWVEVVMVWKEAALPMLCNIVRKTTTRSMPQSYAGYLSMSWPLGAL